MKAAIYCRVSTDDKGQDWHLQEEACVRYASAYGWEYQVYKDEETAYRKPAQARQGLLEALASLRRKEAQVLLVYAMNRLTREDPYRAHALMEEIVKKDGARFISIADGLDSNNPVFVIVFTVMAWQANNWAVEHGRFVADGIARARKRGNGRWGRHTLEEHRKDLKATFASILPLLQAREITQLAAAQELGMSTRSLRRRLNALGKNTTSP